MNDTLHSLAILSVQAIPTILFFVFLTLYLKSVFFKPIAGILTERRKATEGVRDLAQKAFEAAEKKNSEFERALEIARAEIHQEHEALRRQWSDEQSQAIAKTRADAERQIEEARQRIAGEADKAQADLESSVEGLSRRIEESLLKRKAA